MAAAILLKERLGYKVAFNYATSTSGIVYRAAKMLPPPEIGTPGDLLGGLLDPDGKDGARAVEAVPKGAPWYYASMEICGEVSRGAFSP